MRGSRGLPRCLDLAAFLPDSPQSDFRPIQPYRHSPETRRDQGKSYAPQNDAGDAWNQPEKKSYHNQHGSDERCQDLRDRTSVAFPLALIGVPKSLARWIVPEFMPPEFKLLQHAVPRLSEPRPPFSNRSARTPFSSRMGAGFWGGEKGHHRKGDEWGRIPRASGPRKPDETEPKQDKPHADDPPVRGVPGRQWF